VADQDHLKAQSLGHVVRVLRGFFRWLLEEELISKNPAVKLKEPKTPKAVPKALTFNELELIRDSCQTPLEHALVEFLFATGCRIGEVYGVDRDQIEWDRRAILVLGKGQKEREVYFGATTLLNQGAELVAVQSILGHDKPETTQRYAHLSGTRREEEYKRWFPQ